MPTEIVAWIAFAAITAGCARFGWAVGTWLAARAYGDERCPRCGEEFRGSTGEAGDQ